MIIESQNKVGVGTCFYKVTGERKVSKEEAGGGGFEVTGEKSL